MAYREQGGDPDAEARETEAIQRYGRWSLGVRTSVLTGFALAGVAAAIGVGAFVASLFSLVIPVIVVVCAGGAAFMAFALMGRAVGRQMVLRRTPKKLLALAAAHEVPVEKLTETTQLANRL